MSDEHHEPAVFSCNECQAGMMRLQFITYFTWLDEELVTVPNFPAWVCDVCGKRIEDAGLALAMWKATEGRLLEDGKVHFCHKACHGKLDGDDPVVWSSSELTKRSAEELTDYLRRLVHNTKARIAEDVGAKLLDELV